MHIHIYYAQTYMYIQTHPHMQTHPHTGLRDYRPPLTGFESHVSGMDHFRNKMFSMEKERFDKKLKSIKPMIDNKPPRTAHMKHLQGVYIRQKSPVYPQKSPIFPQKPCISTKEPCIYTKEACMSAKEPCISTKEPCISAKEPWLFGDGA